MPIYTDQMMRKVELSPTPLRIVSLVPSQTELLYDLGLNEEVVGITKFCIHPNEWFKTKTRVGGTKQVNHQKIDALEPDLIIGNKEENSKDDIEILMQKYPVWMSDINTFKDALHMIESIANITQSIEKGRQLIEKIKHEFELLKQVSSSKKRVAYLIWNKPMMVAGKDTFINEMLQICGFENVFFEALHFNELKESYRYPQINEYELKAAQPQLILLSSEPFPFKEKHIAHFKSICPNADIKIVDGEMFSWYGSRLLKAPPYFKKFIA
jgi:ABC-type Fe3+-hydroxamate transport system substrate-binding protein